MRYGRPMALLWLIVTCMLLFWYFCCYWLFFIFLSYILCSIY